MKVGEAETKINSADRTRRPSTWMKTTEKKKSDFDPENFDYSKCILLKPPFCENEVNIYFAAFESIALA